MSDPELFDLCKAVYERTGWDEKKDYLWIDESFHNSHPEWDSIETSHHDMSGVGIPFYTSDCLLEKMPRRLGDNPFEGIRVLSVDKTNWGASLLVDKETAWGISDTPLKALLKLTMALSDAGVEL